MPARRRGTIALALVLGLAVTAAACGGDEEEPPAAEEHAEAEEGHEEGEAVEVPADAQTFTVVGTEFAFDPAEFTVEAGRPVAVTFVNEGAVEHDWALHTADGQEVEGAHAHAPAGGEAIAVFTLDPGTYEVVCTLAGHEEAGMVGSVVAE